MATHRIPILNGSVRPDTSGKVWAEPMSILATNDAFPHYIWRFDEDGANNAALTTRVLLSGMFNVPKNYVGSAVLVIVWTSTVTTNDVVWDWEHRTVAGNDSASFDQTAEDATETVTDTAPSASWERMEATITLTDAHFAADETVQFNFGSDGTDGADTLAGARLLFGLYFQYADA